MKISTYKKIFGVGPLGALISLILMLPFWWMDQILGHPEISQSQELVRIPGFLMIIAGAGIHLLTIWTLRRWWVKNEVCTSGTFKYFRHPMYAAWITFIAPGISLCFNSWVFLLWPVILHPVWHLLVTREEKTVLEIFGKQYTKYAGRTGRFIPRFF